MDLSKIIEGIEIADALWLAGGSTAVALISEFLPQTKKIKANSTFQLIFNLIKAIVGVLSKNADKSTPKQA